MLRQLIVLHRYHEITIHYIGKNINNWLSIGLLIQLQLISWVWTRPIFHFTIYGHLMIFSVLSSVELSGCRGYIAVLYLTSFMYQYQGCHHPISTGIPLHPGQIQNKHTHARTNSLTHTPTHTHSPSHSLGRLAISTLNAGPERRGAVRSVMYLSQLQGI